MNAVMKDVKGLRAGSGAVAGWLGLAVVCFGQGGQSEYGKTADAHITQVEKEAFMGVRGTQTIRWGHQGPYI